MGLSTEARFSAAQREVRFFGLAFVFLVLLAAVLVLSPVVRTGNWMDVGQRWELMLVLPSWAASAWWIHRQAQVRHPNRDPFLLPSVYLLTGWGLLFIWRLAPAFGLRQLIWFMAGSALLGFMLKRPGVLALLRRYRILWLLGGLLLTALTLVFGTHPSGGDQRLWLRFLGIYIQPSEPLRLLLIVYLASYFSTEMPYREAASASWLQVLAPLLVMWGLSVGILFAQRDLGTATLVLAVLAGLLFLSSGRRWVLAAAGGLALLAAGLGYTFSTVVRVRLSTWLNPWVDPINRGYQMIQSLIAIASGGLLGQGPGLGSPGFIPAVHTDFIFAAVLEEMGAVGGVGMIVVFALLIHRGLRIALHHRDVFQVLLAAGLTVSLGFQALYIMGGVLRVLPLAGITLPFVSYGGSSLVTSLFAAAILVILSDANGATPQFERPLRDLSVVFTLAWAGLALVVGWWTVYRAPVLIERTDNPRRALQSRYSLRGDIVDREGVILAESTGEQGEYVRHYPEDAASMVVGFDSVMYGKSGVEETLDEVLRGDALRDPWEIWWSYKLFAVPPEGLDVRLTIDLDLQQAAADALAGWTGAVVIVEPETGEIRALASSPGYQSSTLDEAWSDLVQQADSPLLNRAVQGAYQPGMTMAPFTYAWALQAGAVQPEEVGNSVDALAGVDIPFACQAAGDPFPATWEEALQRGCPQPFAAAGALLGEEDFSAMLAAFAFDRTTGVPLLQSEPDADNVLDPSREAIGQGNLRVSPLQMARAWSALVNDGLLPGLSLVEAIRVPDGSWEPQSAAEAPVVILEADAAEGLSGRFRYFSQGVWGYEASASTGSEDSLSWFLGYGTARTPLVIVVVLEDGSLADASGLAVALLGGNTE